MNLNTLRYWVRKFQREAHATEDTPVQWLSVEVDGEIARVNITVVSQKQKFGASSDKTDADFVQLRLDNEAEQGHSAPRNNLETNLKNLLHGPTLAEFSVCFDCWNVL